MDQDNIFADQPLSVPDVARLCRVPEYRVRYWIHRKLLPASRIGRIWLVRRGDLVGFRLPEHVPGVTVGRPHIPLTAVG
jgi:hypothetical protein